jgi:hypothetical protein
MREICAAEIRRKHAQNKVSDGHFLFSMKGREKQSISLFQFTQWALAPGF